MASHDTDTVLAVMPSNIDWNLLAQQKAWLAEIPAFLDPQGFTDGLLTFIDAIQDAYAVRLGVATVFPHLQNDGPGSPQWAEECQEFGCHDDRSR